MAELGFEPGQPELVDTPWEGCSESWTEGAHRSSLGQSLLLQTWKPRLMEVERLTEDSSRLVFELECSNGGSLAASGSVHLQAAAPRSLLGQAITPRLLYHFVLGSASWLHLGTIQWGRGFSGHTWLEEGGWGHVSWGSLSRPGPEAQWGTCMGVSSVELLFVKGVRSRLGAQKT